MTRRAEDVMKDGGGVMIASKSKSVPAVALAIALASAVGLGSTSAEALPHGCISVGNDYSLSGDLARRSVVLKVYTNEPCSFFFSPGDTFSGTGEYVVRCETGGVANDSLAMGPQIQVPIPQPCDPGARVTIDARHPWRGGAVVAGSPV